jgi:hypothetical protein
LFVGEDKPVKDVEAAIALAMAMETDADRRSRSQNKATVFLKKALEWIRLEYSGIKPARTSVARTLTRP